MKKCKDCSIIPVFGKAGTKNAEYCKKHAPSDYIAIVKN